ncbi:hypothetical protein NPIL_104771 [Nephila pilipes]|uniref:Uncharacterized protein n=1 Tax=Nephila pilipes TaxID=299642 RepID=A0A8X6R5J2_NEPPI|nr:hypothetical protein NPIL_104771 [Nephila pilipes]
MLCILATLRVSEGFFQEYYGGGDCRCIYLHISEPRVPELNFIEYRPISIRLKGPLSMVPSSWGSNDDGFTFVEEEKIRVFRFKD